MVHVTLPRPFQGCLSIHGLAIATDNLPTKFEVSISTHYEDMKDDTKCREWGGLGVVSVLLYVLLYYFFHKDTVPTLRRPMFH